MKDLHELAQRVNSATVHLMRALRDGGAAGPAAEHASVLAAVVYAGPISIGDLARREGVGAPAMTKAVGVLERQRLVRRSRRGPDRRVVTVAATPAGRQMVLRGRNARVAGIARGLAALPESDRARLRAAIGALERLVQDLERPEVRKVGTLKGRGRSRPLPR